MKRFVIRLTQFLAPIMVLFLGLLFVPATPRIRASIFFGMGAKLKRIQECESPRIIFLGGSGTAFGLNSEAVGKATKLNPVNMGLHANLGARFILTSVEDAIREGDHVVICFEYEHYHRSIHFASEALYRMCADVDPKLLHACSVPQLIQLVQYVPGHGLSKLEPSGYKGPFMSEYYTWKTYNEVGDAVKHYGVDRQEFVPLKEVRGKLRDDVLDFFEAFVSRCEAKGATCYFAFPAYEAMSYDNSADKIAKVFQALQERRFRLIGTPEANRVPMSLCFDTHYHLTQEGVDHRTALFIKDFQKVRQDGP